MKRSVTSYAELEKAFEPTPKGSGVRFVKFSASHFSEDPLSN